MHYENALYQREKRIWVVTVLRNIIMSKVYLISEFAQFNMDITTKVNF